MKNTGYNPDTKKFIFEDYFFDLQTLEAKFYYSFDSEIVFEEVICFDDPGFDLRADIDFEILENFLFHLHIALGISYYKAYPTTELIIKSGKIDEKGLDFWKKFYRNGLGEFLFINNISAKKLFQFKVGSDKELIKKVFSVQERALVPIGGGKDSLVSVELLKKTDISFDTFVFGKMDAIKEACITKVGKNNLLVTRKISEKLFELNNAGYFNGHVPITGIIAFAMQVTAYLYDYKYLVLSNELSSNFGNTSWEGMEVNHQYSKSLEFEQDLQKYIQDYMKSDIVYFSLLRGMYEVKIAELFSRFGKKYFEVFSSCNNNFQIQESKRNSGKIWCNNCPKCAFVFAILRPYLTHDEVLKIFGKDLYETRELEGLFKELLGISGIKPFECVGTNEEVVFSMYKTIQNNSYTEGEFPYILKVFQNEVMKNMQSDDFKKIENKLFKIHDDDIIPAEIKKAISELT